MFKISSSQIDAMGSQQLDDFVRKTILHLQSRFPRQAAEFQLDELDQLVRTAYERGEHYDVTSAYDVERMSECLLLHGVDFGESSETDWAREILVRDDLTGRNKMNAIANYEAFSLRAAV